MLYKQAYELGVELALRDAELTKEARWGEIPRVINQMIDAPKEDRDRKVKALATLLGAGAAGVGTGLATDSVGYGALAAPAGGAAGYGLASLLSDRGAKWF